MVLSASGCMIVWGKKLFAMKIRVARITLEAIKKVGVTSNTFTPSLHLMLISNLVLWCWVCVSVECISDLKAGVFHIYNFVNTINILTADILELEKS